MLQENTEICTRKGNGGDIVFFIGQERILSARIGENPIEILEGPQEKTVSAENFNHIKAWLENAEIFYDQQKRQAKVCYSEPGEPTFRYSQAFFYPTKDEETYFDSKAKKRTNYPILCYKEIAGEQIEIFIDKDNRVMAKKGCDILEVTGLEDNKGKPTLFHEGEEFSTLQSYLMMEAGANVVGNAIEVHPLGTLKYFNPNAKESGTKQRMALNPS